MLIWGSVSPHWKVERLDRHLNKIGGPWVERRILGVEIGYQLAFQMGDHVFEHEFSFFESLQFKLVD